MKYDIEDSNDDLFVVSDLDVILKKIVNESGDEAIFVDPYCIQCRNKVDIKIDNFTFYQAQDGQHYLYCEKCKSPYKTI